MTGTPQQLRNAIRDSSFDWLALGSAANIGYATEYRSVGGDLFASHRMLALVSAERTVLVGGASDGAAALESAVCDDYVPFGTFYFESADGNAPESRLAGRHDSFPEAVITAVATAGIAGRIGIDAGAADLTSVLPSGVTSEDASDWMYELRAIKLPAELALLHSAARLAEQGIDAAIAEARVGVSEIDLANIVAVTMAAGGAMPRFVVVTSGPRSALSDARPTSRQLQEGDLVRFDVGCTLHGYWSDIGRTAVVGEPDELQTARYEAILTGEEAQLRAARPGVTADSLFELAVKTVEAAGLAPYRRHHCGHAIGTEVYERPVIAPGWPNELLPGMVFCFETPYYEMGWGGMMVEDALVITDSGAEVLTVSDRSLRVIEP